MTDEEALKLAYDNAPIGLVLSEARVIKACNQTFADLVGYDRDALIGQSFQILYDSSTEFQRVRDVGMKDLMTSGLYSDERLVRNRDGSARWCRFRARAFDPGDPLARIVLSYASIATATVLVSFTPRERDVVLLLRQGKTSKEIARVLGLSPRTIEDVRARLLKKMEVRNSGELLAKLTIAGV